MTDFLKLVEKRYSCRSYKSDSVPEEYIKLMLEAAGLAPSACNKQPWRFAVITGKEKKTEIFKHGLLPGISAKWISEAPVIITMGIQRSFITHYLAPKISKIDYALIDAGIAGEHLVLQATHQGLGTCWIGWIRPKEIRRIVEWPRSILPIALIAVGWPDDSDKITGMNRLPETETVKWIK
jgi:nitroreductase